MVKALYNSVTKTFFICFNFILFHFLLFYFNLFLLPEKIRAKISQQTKKNEAKMISRNMYCLSLIFSVSIRHQMLLH